MDQVEYVGSGSYEHGDGVQGDGDGHGDTAVMGCARFGEAPFTGWEVDVTAGAGDRLRQRGVEGQRVAAVRPMSSTTRADGSAVLAVMVKVLSCQS